MPRTLLLGSLAALVLTWSWLPLEREPRTRELLAWALLAGVVPALLPRRSLRLLALVLAGAVTLERAVGTAAPGRAIDRFTDGFLRYYDVELPFRPGGQPLMHGLVLLAVVAFTAAVSLAVAERRALAAAGLLVAGAAWPATLLTSTNDATRGAVLLAAALVVVAGLSSAARARQAALAGAAVVAAAVGVAAVPAVAKGAFLDWETWEPPRKPALPVSVDYVWQTSYTPLTWPAKKTTVLTVEAPPVSRYWRATTLDVFHGDYWLDTPLEVSRAPVRDPLMPAATRDEDRLVAAKVKVAALQDRWLVGASIPVRFDADDVGEIYYQPNGTAYVPEGVPRGATYTTWSYTARPGPRALAQSRPVYPRALDRYLIVQERTDTPPTPAFGSSGRAAAMEAIFDENPGLEEHRPLYERALEVAGGARSPYAAVVALESYFRDGRNFTYDQTPPTRGELDPLVEFVTRTHRGYCQHFAGAMALMLRYLGVPARVAAGFTSGRYDAEKRRWTVTDHDAHTWVEVWFRGYGWLPFDPTPGRGDLDGSYSAASLNFSAAAVAAAIAAGGDAADFKLQEERFERAATGSRADARDLPGDVATAVGGRDEGSLLRLLALAAIGLAAVVALLKLVRRRARYLTSDPRRVAGACRRELAEFLSDQRVRVPESATVAELRELVRYELGVDAGEFASALEAARYGPPAAAGEAARRARRELRRLERAIRAELSAWERARGAVSVRSLGLSGS